MSKLNFSQISFPIVCTIMQGYCLYNNARISEIYIDI